MSRINPLINNFSFGEMSPLTMGRVNSAQYMAGCQTVENMLPDPRGGIANRGGSVYVAEVKDSTKAVRLVPFVVSEIEAYVLEIGDQYIRYYDTNHAQVESSPSVAYETASPWLEAELRDVHFAQSNDELRLVHDGYHPRRLTYTSATSWAIANDTNTGAPWDGNADGHADGFPRSICFYEQRLWFGGTLLKPNYLWGSRVADFVQFTIPGTPANDDPVEYAIAAYTRDTIQWLSPSGVLLIGTTGAEFRLIPDAYIATDRLPDLNAKSNYGSRHIVPARLGAQTLFVQSSGRELRSYELNTKSNVEVYESLDLSFLSEHITEGGIVEMAVQKSPRSVLWAVRSDGVLLSMTYDPSLQGTGFEGLGWARHDLGGTVESVCVIPNNGIDEVWVAVNRTIDGATARYVEYLSDSVYTDSSLYWTGTATDTITGLDHLEGETLDVVADNAVQPQVTVSSGQIILNAAATEVWAGLRFTPLVTPNIYEGGNPAGTSLGSNKSWGPVSIKLHESGLPLVNGDRAPDRSPASPMDATEPLVTGNIDVSPPSQDSEAEITISQDLPLPLNILAIHGNLAVNQG